MKMLQIRHMPDEVHRILKARAAMAGVSLSDYALTELRRLAAEPTEEEVFARIAARKRPALPVDAAEIIRAERDGR